MTNFYDILCEIPIFKTIEEHKWNDIFLSNACHINDYSKGSIIHLQNDNCLGIEVILSGIITIQRLDSTGNAITISDFYMGDILGSNIVFSSKPFYPMTVFAKQQSKILILEQSIVLKLCAENTEFLNQYLNQISDKTIILTGKITSIAMKNIRQCIIDFLLKERKVQKSNTSFL